MWIGETEIVVVSGDITAIEADGIVNAANSHLAGGGGVDGAIHRAGGPSIMEETRRLYSEGCPTGSAVVTAAGRLPAQFVIHAVGPVWHGGTCGEPAMLASAYLACLEIADKQQMASLAFPALSTGVYSFPKDKAAIIEKQTIEKYLRDHPDSSIRKIYLVRYA